MYQLPEYFTNSEEALGDDDNFPWDKIFRFVLKGIGRKGTKWLFDRIAPRNSEANLYRPYYPPYHPPIIPPCFPPYHRPISPFKPIWKSY